MGITLRYRIVFLAFCVCVAGILFAQPPHLREYRIALVLPFKSSGPHRDISDAMLDYYEGFRKAAEDLEEEGLKLKLYVFDSDKDSSSLETIFSHPDMPKMDIIVGPVFEKQMQYAEDFCRENDILLISPLKFYEPQNKKTDIINFFVTDSVRIQSMACKAAMWYKNYKFYIATDNSAKSKEYTEHLKIALNKLKVKNVRTLTWSGTSIPASALPKDSVVILSAIAKASAKDILAKAIKGKTHAMLFAHLDWHELAQNTFEVDEPYVVYPEVNFLDPSDSTAINFKNDFIERIYSEPSKYAYIGYDQATYLCYGLMTFGRRFIKHLPDAEYRGFINVIHLQSTQYGFQNIGLNYLQVIEEEQKEFEP